MTPSDAAGVFHYIGWWLEEQCLAVYYEFGILRMYFITCAIQDTKRNNFTVFRRILIVVKSCSMNLTGYRLTIRLTGQMSPWATPIEFSKKGKTLGIEANTSPMMGDQENSKKY